MEYDQIYLRTSKQWREWLLANHDKTPGIWLLHYKKHTGRQSIAYHDAVEEALCFGWIDSLIKRVDKEMYMQKYTPRNSQSSWSESNKKRVEKLINLGKMTPAGLKTIRMAKENGKWDEMIRNKTYTLSSHLNKMLLSDTLAAGSFRSMTPSQQKTHIFWIMSAKKEETQIRRLKKMMQRLREGKRIF